MLMRSVWLLQRRHPNYTRTAVHWSRQHFSWCHGLQRSECVTLRLQARSRLGGGTTYNTCSMLLLRSSSSDKGGGIKDKGPETSTDLQNTDDGVNQLPAVQTKNFEIKTSKGILSITTTIEDSKINEIVFEKAELSPVGKLNEPVLHVMQGREDVTTSAPPPELIPTAQQRKDECAPSLMPPPKRPRFDYRMSLERNFITPARALSDFMLTVKDLEKLPKIKRRSPYEQEPPMTVYWRRDVEAKALEVWGSKEGIVRERLKRDMERKQYQQSK